jgi:pimeloyl-ACP methyl ester carboxylesterase
MPPALSTIRHRLVSDDMQPRQDFVQCLSPAGFHRMAYVEWGAADNPQVLICVHGLTRLSRDFDRLARALADHYRVICPDVVGRGASDRLANPAQYGIPQYAADMVALIARCGAQVVDWVGTSMGGLIGIALAGQARAPIRQLVLNDVGPRLGPAALARIAGYVSRTEDFADLDEAARYVSQVAAPFGLKTIDEWRELVAPTLRPRADGRLVFHYDPAIAVPFGAVTPESAAAAEAATWALYDRITARTLLVRGAQSDLLLPETAAEMAARGPRPRVVEVPEVGHAPTLMPAAEIAPVRDFLLEGLAAAR